jgi:hypothetical protein
VPDKDRGQLRGRPAAVSLVGHGKNYQGENQRAQQFRGAFAEGSRLNLRHLRRDFVFGDDHGLLGSGHG